MPQDENRVFDVSKPHKVKPSANSRPMIVGHHPMMSDPMVTENRPDEPEHSPEATMTHVPVAFDTSAHNEHQPAVEPTPEPNPSPAPEPAVDAATAEPEPIPPPDPEAASSSTPEPADASAAAAKETFFVPPVAAEEAKAPEPEADQTAGVYPSNEPEVTPATPASTDPKPPAIAADSQTPGPLSDLPLPTHHNGGHHINNDAHHHSVQPAKADKNSRMWLKVLIVLLVLIGVYAVLDAETSVKLPFYVFRKTSQPTPAAAGVASTPPATSASSSDPYNGWNSLKLSGEKLTLKYPNGWKYVDNSTSKANLDANGTSFGDSVTIVGTNNFNVIIQTGQQPLIDTSGFNIDRSDSVTFASQSADLNFLELGRQNTGKISEIELVESGTSTPFPAKNVAIVSSRPTKTASIQLFAVYTGSNSTTVETESLASLESDLNYKDLKLIIQSMSY